MTKTNHTNCKYGVCILAVCTSSDSNMTTKKCWCPECKETRKEIRNTVRELNAAEFAKLRAYAGTVGA